MRILVIGGGGREHAIIRKLKESPLADKIYAMPGNAGIGQDAVLVPFPATDLENMVAFAQKEQIDYVVVAPDDPLALGAVDKLREAGIPAFGPTKAAARIEASKAFAKGLMKKYGIPTASYEIFSDADSAFAYLESAQFPIVIKADGLALGKGVVIAGNLQEAREAVEEMMLHDRFGSSGHTVVIEEYLEGPEISVLSFTDGKTIRPMASSMDHKRAMDGDQGLNTGGMGTIAPNPYYTADVAEECMRTIFLPTIRAMAAEGCPFTGCLYFGLMLTARGPKVIEYNCRFGDPETQVVLPLLDGDLLELMQATTNGTLDQVPFSQKPGYACCVILASGGYPASYQTGFPISGLEDASETCEVFHAGTKEKDGKIVTGGGRVLGVTGRGETLEQAIRCAYDGAEKIKFDKLHMRRDIGARALKRGMGVQPE
ncbi:MAG: phosphoribosylamine--glycine ligase [Clostridia bacterium]|nr:phosphoribosylamine--glycine ligase [Clostridia bacterium]